MEIKTVKTSTLNEKEIKEAIKIYLMDRVGFESDIEENNIVLDATISEDFDLYDFTAIFTVRTDD